MHSLDRWPLFHAERERERKNEKDRERGDLQLISIRVIYRNRRAVFPHTPPSAQKNLFALCSKTWELAERFIMSPERIPRSRRFCFMCDIARPTCSLSRLVRDRFFNKYGSNKVLSLSLSLTHTHTHTHTHTLSLSLYIYIYICIYIYI